MHTNTFLFLSSQPFDPELQQTCLFYIVVGVAQMLQHQFSLDSKSQLLLAPSLWKREKTSFNLGIVSKCAHSPAVSYSAVGLMGHVSQLYNRVSRSGTIVWMVGVKGQALAALGITASVALQKRRLILCFYYALSFKAQGLQHSTGLYWCEASDEPLRPARHHLQ